MSKKRRITPDQISKIADMVSKGSTSAEVAKELGVSVPTVNNHRLKLKRQGIKLPSKRGRKASAGNVGRTSKKYDTAASGKSSTYEFVINGTRVTISGHASNVQIRSNGMSVEF